jgi:succinate-acetate transporter protein
MGPVFALAVIFGGIAQLIAGFQEQKTGNNFGYCAFTGYGAFWIAFALILLSNRYDIYKSSAHDIGWFLVAFTLFTAILWAGSLRISKALAVVFSLLLVGFILLDLGHFFNEGLNVVAGYELMLCAFSAWYVMAHVIFMDLAGRDVLPVGEPWIK